jgi:hypothetical protein
MSLYTGNLSGGLFGLPGSLVKIIDHITQKPFEGDIDISQTFLVSFPALIIVAKAGG